MAIDKESADEKKPRAKADIAALIDAWDIPEQEPAPVKTTILLSRDAHDRLMAHARGLRATASEVVEFLITTGLRRFVVQDRSNAKKGQEAA